MNRERNYQTRSHSGETDLHFQMSIKLNSQGHCQLWNSSSPFHLILFQFFRGSLTECKKNKCVFKPVNGQHANFHELSSLEGFIAEAKKNISAENNEIGFFAISLLMKDHSMQIKKAEFFFKSVIFLNNSLIALFHFPPLFKFWLFFLSPPTSFKHELYGLTSSFTRLIMKTKYVCHGLISLHVNFHDNRTKWTVTSNIKFCRWGGGKRKKSPNFLFLSSFYV